MIASCIQNIAKKSTLPLADKMEIMSLIALAAITLVFLLFLHKIMKIKKNHGYSNLPNGSLGLPLIGESLSYVRAHKKEQGAEWIDKRVAKYGPIFKTSLFGSTVVFLVGIAGNKFVLGSGEDVLSTSHPKRISDLQGPNNIFELSGSRYRLIKRAMLSFLKPESLRNYVQRMDDSVTALFLGEIKEKETILRTVSFMKKLTFGVACEILFGIRDEATKEAFMEDFHLLFNALGSFPVKYPGSAYSKGLQARARICARLLPILRKRKEALAEGTMCATDDVLSCLLELKDENEEPVSEDTVVDNFSILIIASHDTTAVLLSLLVWKLSNDKQIYSQVLKEQMEVLREKEAGMEGKLTWVDIQKMKYTWQVAQELMRMIPPIFSAHRTVVKDTSFGGYDIPKGWKVQSVTYSTHMEKDIFSNPTEFDPSRFDKSHKPLPPYGYIPFGGGLHSCIGNEFARIEVLTTIHKLVTKFEWSLVHPGETITRKAMPYPSMGLPIKIHPRVTT